MRVEFAVIWDGELGVNLGLAGTCALGPSLGLIRQCQVLRQRRRIKVSWRHNRSASCGD